LPKESPLLVATSHFCKEPVNYAYTPSLGSLRHWCLKRKDPCMKGSVTPCSEERWKYTSLYHDLIYK